MGRTIPSITMMFHQEEEALGKFRRALRKADQLAFDDLMIHVSKHIAEAGYVGYHTPIVIFLLSMLVEEHKTLIKLQSKLDQFENKE